MSDITLGVCGNAIIQRDGAWYTHHSFGRVAELLALRFRRINYFAPRLPGCAPGVCDYALTSSNITVQPGPVWRNSLTALKRPDRLLHYYLRIVRHSDVLFIRGSWPLIWTIHLAARVCGLKIVHWIVGNPPAVMAGEQRGYGTLLHTVGIAYAQSEQALTRLAMRVSRAPVLANGAELARLFQSRQTIQVISTSITESDILVREDTCRGDFVRILFVGFIRPEKGLEYLVRALPLVDAPTPVHLAIVGSWDQFSGERERLARIISELGLEDRVSWEGYASFGRELFDQMDRSDVLVLPSVSEGTPRVLVEARARSLPVVSTTVGGIPSSVSHGHDGLLVPPRDPQALGQALSRVIRDGDLRRRLIQCGRERVRQLTIDRFVDLVARLLTDRRAPRSDYNAASGPKVS